MCLQGETRPLPGKASLEGPSCGVCCLYCLTLMLFSSTPASLALIRCGKTQLECCLVRMAAPWLLGSEVMDVATGLGTRFSLGLCLDKLVELELGSAFQPFVEFT